MKLENFTYIDRAGAWAVVLFTLVAGLMVFDTATCLFDHQEHKAAPLPEISNPPSPAPGRDQSEKSEKPVKPVRILNPRTIGQTPGPSPG